LGARGTAQLGYRRLRQDRLRQHEMNPFLLTMQGND
jgi:hypothetical protein